MEIHGFRVTRHYLGLDTAWRAEFQHLKGGRTIGINSEMDALQGMGHACGHNLIAISGVGVALALKAALQAHNIPGKVVLLGTPGTLHCLLAFVRGLSHISSFQAEEAGGGKVILLERGGYEDMDACIMYVQFHSPQKFNLTRIFSFHFFPDHQCLQVSSGSWSTECY
jgi:metal-dependent amidase/aminoacylase/carboxypeptidase family protein